MARNASVTGPPRTKSTGTSIDNIMCATMWTLNSAGAYFPRPDDVAKRNAAHPSIQAIVRPIGHASPRLRSRYTPRRYTTAMTMASVPNSRSKRQSTNIRPMVGASSNR